MAYNALQAYFELLQAAISDSCIIARAPCNPSYEKAPYAIVIMLLILYGGNFIVHLPLWASARWMSPTLFAWNYLNVLLENWLQRLGRRQALEPIPPLPTYNENDLTMFTTPCVRTRTERLHYAAELMCGDGYVMYPDPRQHGSRNHLVGDGVKEHMVIFPEVHGYTMGPLNRVSTAATFQEALIHNIIPTPYEARMGFRPGDNAAGNDHPSRKTSVDRINSKVDKRIAGFNRPITGSETYLIIYEEICWALTHDRQDQ